MKKATRLAMCDSYIDNHDLSITRIGANTWSVHVRWHGQTVAAGLYVHRADGAPAMTFMSYADADARESLDPVRIGEVTAAEVVGMEVRGLL